MIKEKLLVIGGVAAGAKAAAKARRENQALDITIITNEDAISYAGCGLPYYIGGVIEEEETLRIVKAESFEELRKIKVDLNTEAVEIIPEKKQVKAFSKKENSEKYYSYDTLVIATGALPLRLPVPGAESRKIYSLRTIDDSNRVKEEAYKTLKTGSKSAVVIGSGFIGVETAENLHDLGIKTIIVEMKDQILPGFDYDVALFIQSCMEEKGVGILTSTRVTGFEDTASGIRVLLDGGGGLDADFVVSAAGVKPNTGLAVKAGIETGPTGAIKVDRSFMTSIPHIYAVGDCAETINRQTGKPCWIPLGSTANKMGRIMAENRFGSGNNFFPGVLGTMIIKVFDVAAGKTGMTERDAKEAGLDYSCVIVPGNDTAGYYPGFKEIVTKLIYENKTGRVLGGQVFGWGVIDKPVDILVTAISFNAGLDDLASLDLAYAPPFSNAMASTIASANTAKNRMSGRIKTTHLFDYHKRKNEKGLFILDVRNDEEVEEWRFPDSIHIENVKLDERIGELDPENEYIILCKRSIRAYNSYKYLESKNFKKISVLSGGTVFSKPLWEMLEKMELQKGAQ